MIHLYYGDGKGKTTASIGLALRAHGAGIPVVIVQFLKNHQSGEISVLEKMNGVTVFRGKSGSCFVKDMSEQQRAETKNIADSNLKSAVELCKKKLLTSDEVSVLLVLDELCAAYNDNLVDSAAVENFVENIPQGLELVVTGRNPPQFIKDKADYVTEFNKIKHPFDLGVKSRRGIEY